MSKATITPADFASLYEGFTAPVSRFDCGRKCAPLNGGEPVCCSTQNAVPVVHKVEFDLLKGRTDLWSKFKPYDYATREIVAELTSDCMAIHCKGARHCERDNRTIACRGFPFYPYLTRQRQFVGIGTYWVFEDRCWMMSNLEIVDRAFVEQFIATYEALFVKDNGRIGFPFLLRRAALAVVERQMTTRQFSLHQLARSLHAQTVTLPRCRTRELFNINTPKDWKIAQEQWHSMRDR